MESVPEEGPAKGNQQRPQDPALGLEQGAVPVGGSSSWHVWALRGVLAREVASRMSLMSCWGMRGGSCCGSKAITNHPPARKCAQHPHTCPWSVTEGRSSSGSFHRWRDEGSTAKGLPITQSPGQPWKRSGTHLPLAHSILPPHLEGCPVLCLERSCRHASTLTGVPLPAAGAVSSPEEQHHSLPVTGTHTCVHTPKGGPGATAPTPSGAWRLLVRGTCTRELPRLQRSP